MPTKHKRGKKYRPLTDEEMNQLKIKPQWWLDMHKPITITGYKMPYGIKAETEHEGVKYEGMLHPIERETQP